MWSNQASNSVCVLAFKWQTIALDCVLESIKIRLDDLINETIDK